MQQNAEQTLSLPLLPLRDVVVYPQMVIPLFVGREKSIQALDAAINADKSCWSPSVRPARTTPTAMICLPSVPWPRSCSCSSCPTAPSRC